jgi:hypothetical protein
MSSREHPIAVTADMLAGGRPLHARWRTPPRYGIAEHPRDGTPLLIVSEAVPRGETGALWVGYVLTPPHDGQPVEWAPLGCFLVDEEVWAAMLEPHLPAIRAEAERRVREADAEHRRQKVRDLSALLRGDDVTPDPRSAPTVNCGMVPADPIPADLSTLCALVRGLVGERAQALEEVTTVRRWVATGLVPDEKFNDAMFMATSALRQFNDAETRRLAAAEKDLATARAEIERLTREVEEGRRKLAAQAVLGRALVVVADALLGDYRDLHDNDTKRDLFEVPLEAALNAWEATKPDDALTRLLAEAEARGMERVAEMAEQARSECPEQGFAGVVARTRLTRLVDAIRARVHALRTPTDTTPRGSGEETSK